MGSLPPLAPCLGCRLAKSLARVDLSYNCLVSQCR